jgi:uncharacterized protein (DUF2126 family)
MRIRIQHQTRYRYDRPASLGPHLVRLRPAEHTRARLLTYSLQVSPECKLRWQHDPWGNRIARLTFDKELLASELSLKVDAAFDIRPVNPFDFFVDDRCERLPFRYPDGLEAELAPFLSSAPAGPRLAELLREHPLEGYTVDYLVRLNAAVARRIRYIIRDEPGIQRAEETLQIGSGSCRDSALLLCDALRAHGLAARFVSGYLVQLADEGIIPDEAKGVERDVLDLHAWAEVYVPGAGWIGLDGTSGLLCGEGHVPLAATVDPELAAPVAGTASEAAGRFEFSMQVARLGHEPRPRKPYSDEEWGAIVSAGDAVDDALRALGVRLTCGGEPTWTSRLHPREPEWMTEALGATKWSQALRLASELRRRLGQGTLAMQHLGKQYPGESLPRWALELCWRRDGVPIWREPRLLDFTGPTEPAAPSAGPPATDAALAAARHFGATLIRNLELPPDTELVPGHEDPWHFLREEENLPPDVDPLAADLDASEDRRRLARVLTRGLGRPAGYALPLWPWPRDGGRLWSSCRWRFRRGHMFLVPGDSPMGLRLPLDRLGGPPLALHAADLTLPPGPIAFDPRQRRRTLGAPPTGVAAWLARAQGAPASDDEQATLRTALCLEPRDGVLHLFLPPLPTLEDFLELVAAIEETALELGERIRLEGYPPPRDPRLQSCRIAPDPGVLEVNIPVADSFREYLTLQETIGDAANWSGLCTEKYQLDGREVGSGGGNHLTLGGPSTVESPFLARGELTGGLLRYLQHHPALSYLFAGLFVGPTSQAPRLDEARHDALFELELALAQLPEGAPPFPWTVDRLLRHLLVDVAGNTHRTEVCIDKLYSPDGPAGRLGIVELRAFEMPPHERMAAVQMLLARALVTRLLREPYRRPLVRWGNELHDRFMLPYFLWRDLEDVVADHARCGVALDASWFRPFLDHRCPVMGEVELEGIGLELRTALEPWPTLGEEPAGPVVARYVDSSLERLQLRVSGVTEGRHLVSVNGVELPLRATGTLAERVAGVRFRAWQPPHCLHPALPVHHPLRFEVVDTWARRSLGGCTYHVWHPEGRAFELPPLTAFEAAARRAQRFTREGASPWPVEPRRAEPHPEHPFTLDLRSATLGGPARPPLESLRG